MNKARICRKCQSEMENVAESGEWWWLCHDCGYEENE